MATENIANNSEVTIRKQARCLWIMLGCNLFVLFCFVTMALRQSGPLNLTSLEGTVAVLDEKGEPLPWRDDVNLTFYSHYPDSFFWSDCYRKRNLCVGKSEFGNEYSILIPNYGATLFFHTTDKKYAAVVDLGPKDPKTRLVVQLHPRYSATGRLVDPSGIPLSNYEFSLDFRRAHDFGFYRSASVETFEYEYCVTDADGNFTVDHLIPGLEYSIRVHVPRATTYGVVVKMPTLKPEQYEKPYPLGDVSVRLTP